MSMFDFLIKPKSAEERLFCKKYNIELKRLDNGITIVGIPCKMDSVAWASIAWEFLEGAYGNTPGALHFLEHFINKKVRVDAERNSLDLRAFTSQLEVGEEVKGIANPKVPEYGIWTVLSKIRKALESPSSTVDDLAAQIETERQVIKAEIKKSQGEHDYQVWSHFRKTLYAKGNPLRNHPTITGSESELDKINVNALKDVEKKVLVPKQLLISVFSEGDLNIAKSITQKLEKLFSDFPRGDIKKAKLNKKLLQKINPEFKQGKTYSHKSHLKTGTITTQFVWVLKNKFPTISYFALRKLRSVLSTELFMYSRKMGWGYYTTVDLVRPNDNIAILVLRVDTRKGDSQELLPGIKEVISSVTKISDLICDLESKRQKATPISVSERFFWMVDGFKDHNAMISIDKIRPIMIQVKAKDINNLVEHLQSQEPAVVITGDLN